MSLAWVSARFGLVGLISRANEVALGTVSCSSCSHFGPTSKVSVVAPVRLRSGRFKLVTRPRSTGSPAVKKTMGIVLVAVFAARTAGGCWRDNHGHLAANKVGQQCRKLVVAALGPAILDHHSTQLHCIGSALRRALSQITNHWLSGLRAHRERPRCRRPAQKFDEL